MSRAPRQIARTVVLPACLCLVACSESPASTSDGGGDGDGPQPSGTGTLKGVIQNTDDKPVGDALVKVGSLSVTGDYTGHYELANVPAGNVTVVVNAVWYAEKQQPATVKAGETTTLDLRMDAAPLKIDPADKKLADQHAALFDWTKDELSVAVIEGPTPSRLGSALYLRNPAMYRDTSTEDKVTPSPLPEIGAGGTGFDFQAGDHQALDATTIVDSLEATPIPAASRAEFGAWEPLLRFLTLGVNAANLSQVDAAVRQQQWASDAILPQQIERVWLHAGELWVCIVFEPFVELGSGITDSDGDGRKEIFAKIASANYTQQTYDELAERYFKPKLTTLSLKEALDNIVNDLYVKTKPEILKTIGEPFEAAGLGTFKYPFAVLRHTDGAQNVLLVGP